MKNRDLAAALALLGMGLGASKKSVDLGEIAEPYRSMSREEVSKRLKTGGKVGSASKRADGCCQRGKTRGKMV